MKIHEMNSNETCSFSYTFLYMNLATCVKSFFSMYYTLYTIHYTLYTLHTVWKWLKWLALNSIRISFFGLHTHTLCRSNRTKGMEYHSNWIIHHVGILLFLRYIRRSMIITFFLVFFLGFFVPLNSGKAKWAILCYPYTYVCMVSYG